METTTAEKLKELGFEKAATKLKEKQEFHRKLAIAYDHFRYVRPEKIDQFNASLKEKTLKKEGNPNTRGYKEDWKQLVFTEVSQYEEIPPVNVLDALTEAKKLNCFDYYEIARIQNMQYVFQPDPILFGLINGCPDRFYVAQWDSDVLIEEILNANEG